MPKKKTPKIPENRETLVPEPKPEQQEIALDDLMTERELIFSASAEVAECLARKTRCETAKEKADAAFKESKADYETAVEAQLRIIDECRTGKTPGPLFESAKKPATDPQAWKAEPLAGYLSAKNAKALADAGIITMGQLAEYTAGDKKLKDIKGIGDAGVKEIEEASIACFAKNPQPKADTPEAVRAVDLTEVVSGEIASDLEGYGYVTIGDVIDFLTEQKEDGESLRDIGFMSDEQSEQLRASLVEFRKARGPVAMALILDKWLMSWDDAPNPVTDEEHAIGDDADDNGGADAEPKSESPDDSWADKPNVAEPGPASVPFGLAGEKDGKKPKASKPKKEKSGVFSGRKD